MNEVSTIREIMQDFCVEKNCKALQVKIFIWLILNLHMNCVKKCIKLKRMSLINKYNDVHKLTLSCLYIIWFL